ncbi:hypothetical protein A0H81_14227 [Grifola frondosa]|uniref:Uncharacterized protein n=1 Tax=Grifola frondosa TaxID=5627 RepID=A0A1C7LM15_GRIFR|nr:hypothetical protein A0H81_14227 [Grifola frondosa]
MKTPPCQVPDSLAVSLTIFTVGIRYDRFYTAVCAVAVIRDVIRSSTCCGGYASGSQPLASMLSYSHYYPL